MCAPTTTAYHLFDREMLFHLKEDPYEQHDVKDRHPEVCAQGAKIILDWHDQQMMKSQYPVDPMLTVLQEGGPYHTWWTWTSTCAAWTPLAARRAPTPCGRSTAGDDAALDCPEAGLGAVRPALPLLLLPR